MTSPSESWILSGARVADGPERASQRDVYIAGGRFATAPPRRARRLDLSGTILLPGLLNAHDHLEFALFPRLGKGPYPNAKAWAAAIYRPERSPIREHLLIPKRDRLRWGGLRNLLGGATTLCHHNPYDAAIFDDSFPVRVAASIGWAHSLAFSADVAERFRATPPGRPFVIHLAEGTDADSAREVFELDRIGALTERTVAVHGVGLDAEGLDLVERRGAALVCCPSSNLFTLGRTLAGQAFERRIPIALGTDSPLTAEGDLFDELRAARERLRLSAEAIYRAASADAARILGLEDGTGAIETGSRADLIALRDGGLSPAETLAGGERPLLEAAIVGGELKLLSDDRAGAAAKFARGFSGVVYDARRYRVAMDLDAMFERARRELGEGVPLRLGGKPIAPAIRRPG